MDFDLMMTNPDTFEESDPDLVEPTITGTCRGYPIPDAAMIAVLSQTSPLWVSNVVPDSTKFCRPWGDSSIYVYYDLINSMFSSGSGADVFRGYALPEQTAVEIGLVTPQALSRFMLGEDQPKDAARVTPITDAMVAREQTSKKRHKARMKVMAEKDADRVGLASLGRDLAESAGNVTGMLIAGVGKVLGTGAAAFLTGLGPIGAGVVFVGAGYGIYRVTRRL